MSLNSRRISTGLIGTFLVIGLATPGILAGTIDTSEEFVGVRAGVGLEPSSESGSLIELLGLNSLLDTTQLLLSKSLETLQVTQPEGQAAAAPDHPGPGDHPVPGDHPGPGGCGPDPSSGCPVSPVK